MRSRRELTALEATRRLGISLEYLYRLLWTGKLPGKKVGKQWRVSPEAVEERLRRRGE
jgi:excisionase family DNA binding protein